MSQIIKFLIKFKYSSACLVFKKVSQKSFFSQNKSFFSLKVFAYNVDRVTCV